MAATKRAAKHKEGFLRIREPGELIQVGDTVKIQSKNGVAIINLTVVKLTNWCRLALAVQGKDYRFDLLRRVKKDGTVSFYFRSSTALYKVLQVRTRHAKSA